ncbi:hypothetical protein NCAS_0H03030 [Naumovozyma castellii]|uniref:Uncharacterized protein n=1 Tax=Naumovozyma castellii TaxID=27288 RepID=G0VJD4_NAUCA|nr:hypothetical protein NCAS_0H03030 [Naumovozyma castellii CBS 4309]CCC71613.1 hypothetical protein NCAS_0H03030 [Naumovozyma castellii CBS 4309]
MTDQLVESKKTPMSLKRQRYNMLVSIRDRTKDQENIYQAQIQQLCNSLPEELVGLSSMEEYDRKVKAILREEKAQKEKEQEEQEEEQGEKSEKKKLLNPNEPESALEDNSKSASTRSLTNVSGVISPGSAKPQSSNWVKEKMLEGKKTVPGKYERKEGRAASPLGKVTAMTDGNHNKGEQDSFSGFSQKSTEDKPLDTGLFKEVF